MNNRLKVAPLRKKAERILTEKKGPAVGGGTPSWDVKKLIHELQVHQVELEMQNEELRKAQAQIEMSRSKYADLYDFSPAGYFTFNRTGVVKELNLSGARLLGLERSLIIGKPFQVFIAPEGADIFTRHRLSVLKNPERQKCELRLTRMDKTSFYASMESVATRDDRGHSTWIRSAIVDITELKEKEQTLIESEERLRHLSLRLLNAHEEERKRIAGEIHDVLGSCLSGIKFKAEDMLQRVEKIPDTGVETLRALILMTRECIEECRRIQMDLRPPLLDDLGLRSALSWFFRNFETTYSHIRVEQEVGIQESAIPDSLKIVIYRVTQEALANAAKHSKANQVVYSLNASRGKIELTITDNGTGFEVDEVLARERSLPGLGLASMKERTRFSGGSFSIQSGEGTGTTIRASWPISP